MTSIAQQAASFQNKIAKMTKSQDVLRKQLAESIKNILITCEECGKKSKLRFWVFIQRHWYTQPRGCMEGDYWNASTTELCHIRCPKCGSENYIYNHNDKKKLLRYIDKIADDAEIGKNELFTNVEDRHKK
ncbi:MAG: hypothetical protein HYT27_02715 [Parcubacteria group bacterium]|nr:hypothetical protein [Parcubacteria group bacterium]